MALDAGTRLGPYEIVAPIGAGGMGEVYKATDTRLGRTVAIKILPDEFSGHDDMKARFEREARTIAGLNHPNICTLHDIGEGSVPAREAGLTPTTVSFLVLEYLEGDTLAARLEKGALPLAETLTIAIAIADALDKAHRQGIVHRDLKPANVMLTKAGPKLLDFGLAKWTAGESDSLAAMPTRADITGKGMMLGTLQYMAPEQIEGKDADARTDIFAFGALVYEMITGRKAFQGKSQATLIASIMSRDPRPISEFVPISPPALEHLVERCLQKEPENRWQTAHSLVLQLRWIAYGGAEGAAPVVESANPTRERLLVAGLGVAVLAIALLAMPAWSYLRGPEPEPPFAYRTPVVGLSQSDFAVSPDGTTVAFVARPESNGPSTLWVRPVRGMAARRLAGTDDASQPFWSPDGQSIGFVAGATLKRVPVEGGQVLTVASVSDVQGATWNQDNVMLYGSSQGLFRVSAEGGTPEAVTTLEDGETGHYFPDFLPDGRHYLFLSWANDPAERVVYAASLGETGRTEVIRAASNASYAAPGYILFHTEGALFAQPFDAGSLAISEEPIRLAGGMSHSGANGRGDFTVSDAGVLLYYEGSSTGGVTGRAGGIAGNATLGWVTATGAFRERAGESGPYGDFDLSPDGRKIAITVVEAGTSADIWIIDLDRGVPDRLTSDPDDDINPVWSSDGTRVAFTTFRNGNADVYVKNANGVGAEEPLLDSGSHEQIEAWSKDGKYIAYELGDDTYRDLYVKPMDGDGEAFAVVTGRFRKGEAQFSPDGEWLAYITDESTTYEVYVMSFPDGAERRRVSTAGGGQPRWSPDSRTLYYRAPGGQIMAVDLAAGPALDVTPPRLMFGLPYRNPIAENPDAHMMAVAPSGDQFLVRIPSGQGATTGRGGGARGSAMPAVPQTAAQNSGSGRAAAAAAPAFVAPSEGLTVLLNWPSLFEGGQP
jgi:serine/threonine protein kinase/Tol biopolymer transport system component